MILNVPKISPLLLCGSKTVQYVRDAFQYQFHILKVNIRDRLFYIKSIQSPYKLINNLENMK